MVADSWASLVVSVLVPLGLRVAVHYWPTPPDDTARHARRRTTSWNGGD